MKRKLQFKTDRNCRYLLLALLFCLMGIASCSKSGQSTSPVKIGTITWTGFEPLYLAESKNFYQKNNVQAGVKRYASAREVMQAMRDGTIQAAAITLDEAFRLSESGCPVKAVVIVDYSIGGDMIIGRRGITRMKDLKGKRIGLEKCFIEEFLLYRALEVHEIKPRTIELVEVKREDQIAVFKENRIDALVCFNPVATSLLSNEGGSLLFSSREIPGEIIDVLVFSEALFEKDKPAIKKIVKSWFDALEYLDAHFEEAVTIMSSQQKITPAEFKEGLKGISIPDFNENKSVFDLQTDRNIYKLSQTIADFMLERNLLSGRVNTSEFFQPSILAELDKGKSLNR